MADRPNQNWGQRQCDSRGPKFRIDVNNPQMGCDGTNVYLMYAVTDNKEKHFQALSESGVYRLHNERGIEIVAGPKNKTSDTGVKILSDKGDITITVNNGDVRIKGGNIILEAEEDIDLKAGRNITLNAASRILLKGLKVEVTGFLGNLVEKTVGSFLQRAFKGSFVGQDYLSNPPIGDKFLSKSAISGIGDEIESIAGKIDTDALKDNLQDATSELQSTAKDIFKSLNSGE